MPPSTCSNKLTSNATAITSDSLKSIPGSIRFTAIRASRRSFKGFSAENNQDRTTLFHSCRVPLSATLATCLRTQQREPQRAACAVEEANLSTIYTLLHPYILTFLTPPLT